MTTTDRIISCTDLMHAAAKLAGLAGLHPLVLGERDTCGAVRITDQAAEELERSALACVALGIVTPEQLHRIADACLAAGRPAQPAPTPLDCHDPIRSRADLAAIVRAETAEESSR